MDSRRCEYNRWTNRERKLLLDKRIELDHLFKNVKRRCFAWAKVAADIKDKCKGKDAQRCERQWLFLLKKYKSLKNKSVESNGLEEEVWDDKNDFEFYDTIHSYMTLIKPASQLDIEEETFPEELMFTYQGVDASCSTSAGEAPEQFETFVEDVQVEALSEDADEDVSKAKAPKKVPPSCRVCLTTGTEDFLDMSSFVEGLSPRLSYIDCFEQCTHLYGEPDFPQSICFNCAFELREAYVFLEKAKKSDQLLRSKTEHDLAQDEAVLEEKDELIDEIEFIASNLEDDDQEDEVHSDDNAENIPVHEEVNQEASVSEHDENSFSMESVDFIDPNFLEESSPEQVAACEFCGGQFPVKTLKKHMREAHREKNYLCHTCCYTTSNKYTFKNHLKTHDHGRTKNYSCDICGRAFYFKEKLETHMKVHDAHREPKYKCDLCDKRFFYRGSLSTHKNVHKGIMIKCDECGKSFLRRGDYKIHMLNHTGERPFKCEICGGGFTKTFTYKRHMLQHTDHRYTCEVCGAEFKHESSLRVHKVRHTGFLPLSCVICKKGFIEMEKIKRHLRGVHKIYDRVKMEEAINKKKVPQKDLGQSDEEGDDSDLEEEDFWSEIENEQVAVGSSNW